MRMTTIAAHKDSMIYRVFVRNPLTNWIDGIPLHPIPLNVVGLQNPFRRRLHFCLRSLLPGIEIFVCGGRNLDVESHEIVLSRNDHDRAVVTVNSTFHLPMLARSKNMSQSLHTLTSGKSVLTTPSMTPHTFEIGSL